MVIDWMVLFVFAMAAVLMGLASAWLRSVESFPGIPISPCFSTRRPTTRTTGQPTAAGFLER
jgi:hypothetical protein